MLPEVLSNNICSLKPNVDRLAYSILFEMDESANMLDYTLRKPSFILMFVLPIKQHKMLLIIKKVN